ncbi:MAG: hypothetical protein WC438_05230 [Candidatus Pacearchaeota archaeon]
MVKINKYIYWTPRILSILFILFLALFSLDVFDSCNGWGCLLALFMHNIPSIILAVILIISWKREWVGGIAFILAGFAYITLLTANMLNEGVFHWYMVSWSLIIACPAFLIGILFLINWKKRR